MAHAKLRTSTFFSAAALGLAFSASAVAAKTLSAEEFMQTHVGKCISYTGESVGVQCFYEDGTMDYDDETYGKDTGTWTLEGDKICAEWVKDPGVNCTLYIDEGDGVYSEGAFQWTIN